MPLDGQCKLIIGYSNLIESFNYLPMTHYVIQLLSTVMHVKGRMAISNVNGNEK